MTIFLRVSVSLLTFIPCVAQTSEPASIQITVCQLLNRLEKFSGAMVRVSATLWRGPGAFLVDVTCPNRIRLGSIEFNNFVSVQWPSNRRNKISVPFDDDPASEHLLTKTMALYDPTKEDLLIDLEGLVVTRTPPYALVLPGNPDLRAGFGHLGMAPAEIFIKKIYSIRRIPIPAPRTSPAR